METEKLLHDLLAEVQGMDASAFPPNHAIEPEEHETVIGECSPMEQKLFALHRMYSKMRDQHKVEARYHTAEEGCDEHTSRIQEYNTKQALFNGLLWFSVESRLKTFGHHDTLAIRTGWQITKAPRGRGKLPPGLEGFIASIGGGDE